MRKNVDSWTFIRRTGIRSRLTRRRVREIKALLQKAVKVGIEIELNLPDENSNGCKGNDASCSCISIYQAEPGRPCYKSCSKKGNCSIEEEHGCHYEECICFEPLCNTCTKFAVGCGTCPKRQTKDTRPDSVRKRVHQALEPTSFLGDLGKYGVLDVVPDGSLNNQGVEVVTVGRKVDFPAIHSMCKKIYQVCEDEGAFSDERCSVHYHVLAGYLEAGNTYNPKRKSYGLPPQSKPVTISELESPIPEVVLANFHQLFRRFENAIIWLTSSGNSKNHLTRWIKFRQPVKQYSAVRHQMSRVIQEIKDLGAAKHHGRYMMVNYTPVKFGRSQDGPNHQDVTRLHFEIRCADGNMSPTAVSLFAVLFHGMLIKAVELSEFGTLESGDKEYMEQARHIESLLLNNDGDYGGNRKSNTRDVVMYMETLRKQANELVELLHGYLSAHKGAYKALKSLADKPCSLRLSEGATWETIEKDLVVEEDEEERRALYSVVDTTSIVECGSLDEWVEEASVETKVDKDTLRGHVQELIDSGEAFWAPSVGTLVRR